MLPLRIHFPGKLVFGNGCIDQLPDDIAALAPARVFILTITPLLGPLQPFIGKITIVTVLQFRNKGSPSVANAGGLAGPQVGGAVPT